MKKSLKTDNIQNLDVLPYANQIINTCDINSEELNEIRRKLIDICKIIFEVENVDYDDDFYKLGGNSLKAILLEVSIEKEFNVEISISDIYMNLTICKLADLISRSARCNYKRIEPAEEAQFYPLSAAQKGVFINSQREGWNTSFNMPIIKILSGEIDRYKLEDIFKMIIDRHEALRTAFDIIDGQLVQRVYKTVDFKLTYYNLQEDRAKEILEDFIKPFDLKLAPLMRAALIKIGEKKHILAIDLHHIIADGTSISILIEELLSLYENKPLDKLKIQYKDYSVWQNNLIKSESLNKEKNYWLEVLSGSIPVLDIPKDYTKADDSDYFGGAVQFSIPAEVTRKLRMLAIDHNTTLYSLLFSLYTALLSKYSNQMDFIIGLISAGRNYADLENVIGMFANVLPIRVRLDQSAAFSDMLMQIHKTCTDAYENQNYTFDMIIENLPNLPVHSKKQSNPLFNTMFVFHNEYDSITGIDVEGIQINDYKYDKYDSNMDIQVDLAVDKNGQLVGTFEYDVQLYKKETIERMISHYLNILYEVLENPDIQIEQLKMISNEERNRILYSFNNVTADGESQSEGFHFNAVPYPKQTPIYKLFENQVDRTPENTALVFRDRKLSYRELDELSNKVAWFLQEKRLEKNTVVGVMLERSPEMVIGIYGILKAGGAYLPIDPEYPTERIEFLVKNSGIKIILTNSCNTKNLLNESIQSYCIDEIVKNKLLKNSRLDIEYDPKGLIYLLYTSGSTGNPKGVMVEAHSFVNLINWFTMEFDIDSGDNVLLIAPISFDLAQKNLYAPLIKGGQLHLYNLGFFDYYTMSDVIEKEKITIINCTPSSFYPLVELNMQDNYKKLQSLRYVFLGGEPINLNKLRHWLESADCKAEIVNTYGPTECTDIVASYRVKREDLRSEAPVPIGKPIHNTNLYVLNSRHNILPVGVTGELCVGGVGLAQGYHSDTGLTNEKFVQTPHLPSKQVYKTGDLVRWLPDGNIEFIGRVDNQKKIRGYRVELEEVENIMRKCPEIDEMIIIDKEDNHGEKYLCAYYSASEELDENHIREYAQEKMPSFMVPDYFYRLEKLPLNANGKIDRKSLRYHIIDLNKKSELVLPQNEVELKLEEIWCSVLNKDQISVVENFFAIGGNSLKAIVAVSRIHQQMKVELSVNSFFVSPTIRELAIHIMGLRREELEPIIPINDRQYYPTSSAQKRIYAVSQLAPNSANYNIPLIYKILGNIEKEQIERAMKQITIRHDTLRTSFFVKDNEILQMINENPTIDFYYDEADTESDALKMAETYIKPFSMDKAPLFRAALIKIEEEFHVLLLDIHHIISDAQSNEILLDELIRLYNNEELLPLKVQYKDYSVWQNNLFEKGKIQKQENYWISVFENYKQRAEFPLDYERPAIQSFEGDSVHIHIDKIKTRELEALAFENNATLYMLLFSAFKVLLAHYTCSEELVIGTTTSGRTHPETENIIGMFVNTLPIRSYPNRDKTFQSFLTEMGQILVNAYDNQDYQLDMILEKLKICREPNRNPLFDMVFTYLETNEGNKDNSYIENGLDIMGYQSECSISKFDITIYVTKDTESIDIIFEYCSKLFKRETIQILGNHFVKVLETVIANPYISIKNINLEQTCCNVNFEIEEVEFNFD